MHLPIYFIKRDGTWHLVPIALQAIPSSQDTVKPSSVTTTVGGSPLRWHAIAKTINTNQRTINASP